jgi:hypothetical protein
MDDQIVGGVTQEDVVDAIDDVENMEALDMLTALWKQWNKEEGFTAEKAIANAKRCAQMLYGAKRYEDVVSWLDAIALEVSKQEGAESDAYSAFIESEDLENLRMKAFDKSIEEEEEEEIDSDDE